MLSPVGKKASIYNLTSGIERNAALNRGMMEIFGMEIPQCRQLKKKNGEYY